MGWSDLDYRGASVVANDVDLAVWMHYVVEAIDRADDRTAWIDELREDWHAQATGGFGFGVVAYLDKHVTNDRRPWFLARFREALAAMDRHGDAMTADELDALQAAGPGGVFAGDLPMEIFRRVGRGAIALLEGTPIDPGADPRPSPDARTLRLSAEGQGGPLREGGTNLEHRDLPISEDLKRRLTAWSDTHERTLDPEYPPDSRCDSPAEESRWRAEGRLIRADLRRELGPEFLVLPRDDGAERPAS